VGHAAVPGRPSGCTVVLCPAGAACGVDVRGTAPGTRETDALRPGNLVQQAHAVLLAGGSAFGLDAAGGVMRWLEERGHGFPVGRGAGAVCVPIVPGAVVFDLFVGDPTLRPDACCGYAACDDAMSAAAHTAPTQGNVGAGLGATVGKLLGLGQAMRGGLGMASLQADGFVVAALAVVNAAGDVLDERGRVLAGARGADGRPAGSVALLLAADPAGGDPLAGQATTLCVVATDARLDVAQCTALARLAHHGLSRAVAPILPSDGDTVFALATGGAATGSPPDPVDPLALGRLGAAAAEALARAIRNAVRHAQALAGPGLPTLPAARDLPRPADAG
jgi:L-aminopeptidase/D-esterase-like protein